MKRQRIRNVSKSLSLYLLILSNKEENSVGLRTLKWDNVGGVKANESLKQSNNTHNCRNESFIGFRTRNLGNTMPGNFTIKSNH